MMRQGLAILVFLSTGAAAQQPAGKWSLEVARDPQTWENLAVLALDSVNEIADEYATKKVHTQLAFRCLPGGDGTLSVRLDWRRFISSFNTEISFKADEKELLLVNWGVDKSNKITMPRAAKDGQELIDYLKGTSSLQVEVIPYSSTLVTVKYDVSGIDEALENLKSRC